MDTRSSHIAKHFEIELLEARSCDCLQTHCCAIQYGGRMLWAQLSSGWWTTGRCSTGHGTALNELPDQGMEALIDLIMLIEAKCERPVFCNRIVFTAKAAGGVRPVGRPTQRVSSGPRMRVVSSAASGSME